jgi:hypothetical protein
VGSELDRVFSARGETFDGSTWTPVTVVGRYPADEHKPVQLSVVPDEMPSAMLFDRQTPQELRGKTIYGKQFWVPRFQTLAPHYNGTDGYVAYKGISELFIEGDLDEFNASRGEITCVAFLPPVPIAQADDRKVRLSDGTILYQTPETEQWLRRPATRSAVQGVPLEAVFRERQGIRWTIPASSSALGEGEAELIDQYHYADVSRINGRDTFTRMVGVDAALTQIQRYRIRLTFHPTSKVSLKTVLCALEPMLDDALELVSLLSHRRITWYSANAYFHARRDVERPSSEPAVVRHSVVPRRASARRYEHLGQATAVYYSALVREDVLKTGLFQTLLTNLTQSAMKDPIRQSIRFLLASYEGYFPEARLGALYSSLEGLVHARNQVEGRTWLLGSSRFKRLAAKIEEVIREHVVDADTANQMVRKLPELRRPSYADRLLELLRADQVAIENLWPSNLNAESELRGALDRRNILIHQGKVLDWGRFPDYYYFVDLKRLSMLVELWILKLLGCPDDAIRFQNPPYW